MNFTERVDFLIELLSFLPGSWVTNESLEYPSVRSDIDKAYKPENASIGIVLGDFRIELEIDHDFKRPEEIVDPNDYYKCTVEGATVHVYNQIKDTTYCVEWECDCDDVYTYTQVNGQIKEPNRQIDNDEAEIYGWVDEMRNS